MNKLNKSEIEFLKSDMGLDRVIQRENGEIHAVKGGKEIFIGWSADDVRNSTPAMREAVK